MPGFLKKAEEARQYLSETRVVGNFRADPTGSNPSRWQGMTRDSGNCLSDASTAWQDIPES